MALEQTIAEDDHFFAGEDKELVFTIYTTDEQTACLDVSGFALRWRLRSADDKPVIIEKTTAAGITISGVFNATPASNTQVVTVTVPKAATESLNSGVYRQSLARTDTGFATVLTFGDVKILPAR